MAGFTLVEIIFVLAIMTILIGIASPLYTSLTRGTISRNDVSEVALALQMARSYAMANRTYVRLGFFEDESKGQLSIASFYSSEASVDPSTNMNDETTWPMLSKAKQFQLTFPPEDPPSPPPGSHMVTEADFGELDRRLVLTSEASTSIIQFNPNGEASVSNDLVSRSIVVRLIQLHGSNDTPHHELTLHSTTGRISSAIITQDEL